MKRLSTGLDSTLGNYRRMTVILVGEDSTAVKFLDEKIAKEGANAEVLADESQMLYLLMNMDQSGQK